MIDPIKVIEEREIEIKDKDGKTADTTSAKFVKYTYRCRPQVLQRKNNWVKFGKLAKDVPKGENKLGVKTQTGPVYFKDDEG